MPELPEVETVRRGLDPLLRGRAIEEADIMDGRLTAPEDPVVVGAELLGERFTGVGRRGKYLLFRLDSRRTPVVHQGVVAGVGNIYADEALWQARIHPLRPGGELTAAEVRRLHAAVVETLERGIASQGASIRNYRGPDGAPGSMQERFNAYDRDG